MSHHTSQSKAITQQEQIKINGTIKNEAGEIVIGTTIFVKEDSLIGTVADENGHYTLTVPVGSTLTASFLGYQTLERRVLKGIHRYDFILKEESQTLDEVIVIGYGEVKKSDLTGSVSTIGSRNFSDQPVKSISDILQGRKAVDVLNRVRNRADGAVSNRYSIAMSAEELAEAAYNEHGWEIAGHTQIQPSTRTCANCT